MASELIERDLYNGKYHLRHNPIAKGSQPRYILTRGGDGIPQSPIVTKPKGVTTILGKVLAKDFVGWALTCMEEYLTGKLPNITAADLKEAKLESDRRRDSGGSTGTEAHALVEGFLKSTTPSRPSASASPEAMKAYTAFVEWFKNVTPEVINVEEVIYSETFDYAGTYDAMLRIDGKVYLTDLKTTNVSRNAPKGVYAEYFIQLGAYAAAHEEQRIYEENNGGTTLLPIEGLAVISAKKNGKLDIVTNDDVGLTVTDCKLMAGKTMNLYKFLQHTTEELGGKF